MDSNRPRVGDDSRATGLTLPSIDVSPSRPGSDEAQALMRALDEDLIGRYPGQPVHGLRDGDADDPRLTFLVACAEGQPVGCGAIRPLVPGVAEVKRMFVRPEWRGRGVARRILAGLEATALGQGYHTLRLETGLKQPEAIGLYRSAGYTRIPAFGDYLGDPVSMCFEKPLTLADAALASPPAVLDGIRKDGTALGFTMASEPKTGALLAALAATKPGGRLLELGTGTGIGTAWLLAGMDATARLDTVDTDADVVAIATRHLGGDPRVAFHVLDGGDFIAQAPQGQFDLIFADAWPGKFSHLDATLALLRTGGLYVIDDLLPQANWPEGHAAKVPALVESLETRPGYVSVKLAWASGLMLVVRTATQGVS
jgi:predicted O-methyltransferase YrrM/GNAT superfamily N-acetyltransferase